MHTRKETRKIIAATVIGNAMEWYDYLLYAHFAIVISKLFFPMKNANHSLLLTLATFTAGFLARPFGGYIFGLIGDRVGRKAALTFSILLMMLPTVTIGLLPTFAQIGIMAPLIMIFLRILQGISLGGEYSASTTFLVESAPPKKKAFFGSFSSLSLALGVLISALTVLAIELIFTKEEVLQFAWRIPFIISIVYGAIGLYLRRTIYESHEFSEAKKSGNFSASPFKEIFIKYKKNLLFSCGAFMGLTIPFYAIVVFSKNIMIDQGITEISATLINCLLVITYMFTAPLSGYLSDKSNERILLLIGGAGLLVFSYPFFYMMKSGSLALVVCSSIVAGFLIGMYQGAVPSFCAKCFNIRVRASGVSLGYNLPAIVFGGTAPMIVTAIMQYSNGNLLFVSFYIIFGCSAGILSALYSIKFITLDKTQMETKMENRGFIVN